MGIHGLGVIHEPHDSRIENYPASDLLGQPPAAIQTPLAAHIFVPPSGWLDQQHTQACVGFAIAQAIYIRQGALGIPPNERTIPSAMDIYYRARASRHGWQNIVDIGSNPVAGWEVCRAVGSSVGLGLVPWIAFPFVASKINEAPPPHCYQHAVDHDWLRYHWILKTGNSRLNELDALLGACHPVTVAVTCGQAIQHWRWSDGPWRYQGPRKGAHYICLFHSAPDGYWGVGSWGGNYGFGGLHWIARDEIASERTTYLATPVIDVEKLQV